MIEIGKISFKFTARNERFAYRLYAGWDDFCRNCVEKCIDETLVEYDKKGVPLVIDKLDLTIGSIPEEDFYRLFPIRFKEELKKMFHPLPNGHEQIFYSPSFHKDSLLFYLSRGYYRTAWENKEKDLDYSLKAGLEKEPAMMMDVFMQCLGNNVMLERLLLQSNDENFFVMVGYWISGNSFSREEKQQRLFLLLAGYQELFLLLSERISVHKLLWTRFVELVRTDMFRQAKAIFSGSLSPVLKEYIAGYPNNNQEEKVFLLSSSVIKDTEAIDVSGCWDWITNKLLPTHERQRILAAILENNPLAILRFIHGTNHEEPLFSSLIEIMDDIHVLKIMQEESKHHTDMDNIRYGWWLYNRLLSFLSDADVLFGQDGQDTGKLYQQLYGALIQIIRSKIFSTGSSQPELTSMFLEEFSGKDRNRVIVSELYRKQMQNMKAMRNTDSNLLNCILFDWVLLFTLAKLEPHNEVLSDTELLAKIVVELSGKESYDEILAIYREQLTKENPETNSVLTDTLLVMDGLIVESNEHQDIFAKTKTDRLHPKTENILHDYSISLQACLTNENISKEIKREQLQVFLLFYPETILRFLYAKKPDNGVLQILKDLLSEQDLIRVIASVSIRKAELLQQTIRSLRNISQSGKQYALLVNATSYTYKETLFRTLREMKRGEATFGHKESIAIVKTFIHAMEENCASKTILPDMGQESSRKNDDKEYEKGNYKDTNQPVLTNELTDAVLEELMLVPDKATENETDNLLEYLILSNAGVALLTPWFPRLFSMLGLLNEEDNDFKDIESQIRAVFIIQRLVTSEGREYREQELAFNRILVSLPFSVPLPKQLGLSREEIETVDAMLAGVKANWTAMQKTSIEGFQSSFIERSGKIEQKEDRWILTVDKQSYDMLLDSLPWSYKLIRFPWLKKRIHVLWRDKEEMDY